MSDPPPSLADVLPLLVPKLGPALLEDGTEARLERMAAALAPLYQGGFEVRLAGDAPQIDLHQYVLACESQPAELLRHLQRTAPPSVESERLMSLCRDWSSPASPLAISDLWLECDDGPASAVPRPSLFFGLAPPPPTVADEELTARAAVQHVLTDEQVAACWPSVHRCFAACPEPAHVSHLGVMLRGDSPAMRVNVKRLPPDEVVSYVEETGWQGPGAELTTVVDWLAERVERFTVCLDVEPNRRVGFECAYSDQPVSEARWGVLLDDLVDRGLCAPPKRDALLAWPEVIAPPNSPAPWPASLIVASLQSPTDVFSAVDCRVSHVKVTYEPGQPLSAKGYLSFAHSWLGA